MERKKLDDCLDYEQPTNYLVENTEYNKFFKTPVLTAGKSFILGYTNESEGIYNDNLPVIIFDDFTTASQYVNFPFKVKSSAIKILKPKKDQNIKFIYELMQSIHFNIGGHERHWISKYSKIKAKVPSSKEQDKIADFINPIDDMIDFKQQQIIEGEKWKGG